MATSSYFPGGPTYSYATCNSTDSYTGSSTQISSLAQNSFRILPTSGNGVWLPRTTNLQPPLASVTSCGGLTSTSDSCGPLIEGRQTFGTDWCALKAQIEQGITTLDNVLSGLTLDVTVLASDPANILVEDAAGQASLRGITGDILNYIATEANFRVNLYAIPAPAEMGYFSLGYADPWGQWLIDQGARTDLLARWTTDSYTRRGTGVSWPFHHLTLDHVLIVSALGSRLSIESWSEFVASGTGSVCIYGGAVRAAVISVLPLSRVLESPGTTEQFAHSWAAELLRNGTCVGYVQPIDKAENMLEQHNANGGCDLRLLNPPSSERDGLLTHARGGFSTVMPFAREAEVPDLDRAPSPAPK